MIDFLNDLSGAELVLLSSAIAIFISDSLDNDDINTLGYNNDQNDGHNKFEMLLYKIHVVIHCGLYPLKNGVWRPPSSFVRTYTSDVNFVCGFIVPGFANTWPLSM